MSVYIKEKPEFVESCFKSLLKQTVKANEWVIVEDGPISKEMTHLLDMYQSLYPGLIKRIKLKENQGLGLALRIGIEKCSNELIARMDTDDLAREDRFEKQLQMFIDNPILDICGSNIDEFESTPDLIVAHRIVPTTHADIVKYQKKRDPFNHMTVMYKKTAVINAGNYAYCPLMEDTYLWARMIKNGAKCANIGESLVYVRIGQEMFKRRGGLDYFKMYREGKRKVLETGMISKWDYLLTVSAQAFVAIVPNRIRSLIYKKFLHR